jgi:uridine phosphorylase
MTDSKIINKEEETLGKAQYHIHVKPGEVGKYVLLPGDPDRVLRIAKYLDNSKEIAFHREHRTCTGSYKGITISATSTGMGCPSTAIAVEELANVGATHFIRVGSTGALQKGLNIGDLVVSTGSLRLDGTSSYYAHEGFPAVPDHFLTHALVDTANGLKEKLGYDLHAGIGVTSDAFYGETPELIRFMIEHRALNVEMESSVLFIIAHMRGLKAAMICAVSSNLATNDFIYEGVNTGLVKGWDNGIKVVLEAIYNYETKGYEDFGNSLTEKISFEKERYHPTW